MECNLVKTLGFIYIGAKANVKAIFVFDLAVAAV